MDQRVTKAMGLMGLSSIVGYTLPPMMNHIYTTYVLNNPSYDMPFKTDYLYDISKYRAYEMTFFVQAFSCVYAAVVNVSILKKP